MNDCVGCYNYNDCIGGIGSHIFECELLENIKADDVQKKQELKQKLLKYGKNGLDITIVQVNLDENEYQLHILDSDGTIIEVNKLHILEKNNYCKKYKIEKVYEFLNKKD